MWAVIFTALLIAGAVLGCVVLMRRTSSVEAVPAPAPLPVSSVDIAAQATKLAVHADKMVVVLPRSMSDLHLLLHFVLADILREGAFKDRGVAVFAQMDGVLLQRIQVLRAATGKRMAGVIQYRASAFQAMQHGSPEDQARATREFVRRLTPADAQLLLSACVAGYQVFADVHQAYVQAGLAQAGNMPELPSATIIQDLCQQASWNELSLAISHDLKVPAQSWLHMAHFMMCLFERTSERILLPPLRQDMTLTLGNLARRFSRVYSDAEMDAGSSFGALVHALAFLPGFRVLVWSHADFLLQVLNLAIRQHQGIDEEVRNAEVIMSLLEQISAVQYDATHDYRPQGDL